MSSNVYNEKLNTYSSTPATAISVSAVPSAPNYGNTVAVQSQPANAQTATAQRQRPINRWGDSICDWPNNLFPSCWCACCCCYGMYLNAQISEKIGVMKFSTVVGVYVILWVICIIVSIALGGNPLIIYIPLLAAFFYSIYLRLRLVQKNDIRDCGGSPLLGEFCCGFWCWYCSIAQMGRHIYGYNKVLDGDGDPYRLDNYSPTNVNVV